MHKNVKKNTDLSFAVSPYNIKDELHFNVKIRKERKILITQVSKTLQCKNEKKKVIQRLGKNSLYTLSLFLRQYIVKIKTLYQKS